MKLSEDEIGMLRHFAQFPWTTAGAGRRKKWTRDADRLVNLGLCFATGLRSRVYALTEKGQRWLHEINLEGR